MTIQTRSKIRLDTVIRPDQEILMHQMKMLHGRKKSDVVQDALDRYFQDELKRPNA